MFEPLTRGLALALVLALGVACGPQAVQDDDDTSANDDDSASNDDDSTANDDDSTANDDDDATEPPCVPGLLPSVDGAYALSSGGLPRDYLLHRPPIYDGTSPIPLVLNFHGYLFDGADQQSRSGMNAEADAQGFAVAYPDGIGTSWNAGGVCCGTAASTGVDDVQFTRDLVADVAAQLCVDPARIYATGFSNGGFLSHRLACEAGDLIAAVAPVSGMLTMPPTACSGRLAPLFHMHGAFDTVIPITGNVLFDYPSFDESTDTWLAMHGCLGDPIADDGPGYLCEEWSSCDDGGVVRRCLLDTLGHAWPVDGDAVPANAAIWDFFSRFTL